MSKFPIEILFMILDHIEMVNDASSFWEALLLSRGFTYSQFLDHCNKRGGYFPSGQHCLSLYPLGVFASQAEQYYEEHRDRLDITDLSGPDLFYRIKQLEYSIDVQIEYFNNHRLGNIDFGTDWGRQMEAQEKLMQIYKSYFYIFYGLSELVQREL